MPVLGYDTAGTSNYANVAYIYGNVDETDELGGHIKNFHCAILNTHSSEKNVKLAIVTVDQGTGDPASKTVVEQGEFTVAISDDNSFPAPEGNALSASTKYYIGIAFQNALNKVKYDVSDMQGWYKAAIVYADQFPDPYHSSGVGPEGRYSWSIWIDYQHPGVLGYDTVGMGGSHGITNQYRGINGVTDGNGGEIKRFHMSVFSVDAVNKNVKMAVADCAQGDGDPSNGAIIEQIEFQVEVGDDEWVDAAGGNNVLADTKYYIAFAVPDSDTKIKFDILPECWYDWGWPYASVFPNPLDVAHAKSISVLYSIWVDYEEAGGQEFIRSISDTVGITDTLSRSGTFVREVMNTIGIIDIISAIIARVRETDCFGVCRIVKVKAKEKLISAVRKIDFFQHPEE